MVRQLAPGPEGLPIEVYVFTTDIRWLADEGIQGDIFDQLLATIPEFGLRNLGLRINQKPSGADLNCALGVTSEG